MEVQPQLVLLQKTLLNIEGLGRDLYPELDLWQTAKPFLERWMHEQVGARAFWKNFTRNAPRWADRLPEVPVLVYEELKRAESGKLKLINDHPEWREMHATLRRWQQRLYFASVGAALVSSAALVLGLDGNTPLMLGKAPLFTWLLGGLGGLLLFVAWPKGRDCTACLVDGHAHATAEFNNARRTRRCRTAGPRRLHQFIFLSRPEGLFRAWPFRRGLRGCAVHVDGRHPPACLAAAGGGAGRGDNPVSARQRSELHRPHRQRRLVAESGIQCLSARLSRLWRIAGHAAARGGICRHRGGGRLHSRARRFACGAAGGIRAEFGRRTGDHRRGQAQKQNRDRRGDQ